MESHLIDQDRPRTRSKEFEEVKGYAVSEMLSLFVGLFLGNWERGLMVKQTNVEGTLTLCRPRPASDSF